MGRALFSTIYTQPVAVRNEPDVDVPDHSDLPRCEKWSISNPFDPDSDEFYEGATREVFTDTEAWRNEQATLRELLTVQVNARGGTESPSSSEASESDSGSPMAVGSDDPALLIADAFPDYDWPSQLAALGAPADLVARITPTVEAGIRSQLRVTGHRSSIDTLPAFIPISATELSPPQSPTFRRTVPITPIVIPSEPPSPSSPSSATPSTPTDNVYEVASMLTPSPAPSVTPHVYTWHPAPLPAPASPLANFGRPSGPLTNPGARLSFVSLNVRPSLVRAHNAAV